MTNGEQCLQSYEDIVCEDYQNVDCDANKVAQALCSSTLVSLDALL
jgi:hypothetical protein